MLIDEYAAGQGDALHCCCCVVTAPSIQVYGFYLCESCDALKRVISYEENGVLKVQLLIGTTYVYNF